MATPLDVQASCAVSDSQAGCCAGRFVFLCPLSGLTSVRRKIIERNVRDNGGFISRPQIADICVVDVSIGAASLEGISIRYGLRPHCKIMTDEELQHCLRHNTRIDVGAHDNLAPMVEHMGDANNMTTSLGPGIVETTTAPALENIGSNYMFVCMNVLYVCVYDCEFVCVNVCMYVNMYV